MCANQKANDQLSKLDKLMAVPTVLDDPKWEDPRLREAYLEGYEFGRGEFAALHAAAIRVASNAFGTNPRHTRAPGGGCRDDCIPCGLELLAAVLEAQQ